MSEINPISNYGNFPDPIKPQGNNAPNDSILDAHLQHSIDQIQNLLAQFEKSPTKTLKLHIKSVMEKICDFLQNRQSELKAECKSNGWSDEGEENYSHFIDAALKQYDNFQNPQNPAPLASLEQFNTYLTQLHYFATNKSPGI